MGRFYLATKFTGMLIAMSSAIALVLTGVITPEVWQYVMLGSYLVYCGAEVGEYGITALGARREKA